jgi:hypothetical protein
MARFQSLKFLSVTSLIVGLVSSNAVAAPLSSPPVPAAISNLLAQIDKSANSKQLAALNNSFAPNYTVDGLNRKAWEQGVKKLWQRYPNLRYRTTIQSWKPEVGGVSVETMTTISGSQNQNSQLLKLTSQVRSRQKIVSGKIVQQQILSENTTITSGSKPPTVEFNVPKQLKINEIYDIDAIVSEPLGEDIMMGKVVEQTVNAIGYSKPAEYNLDVLATGGLFKKAKAPSKPGDYWLSAVLVRAGGITTVTQRIHVVKR